MKQESFDEFGVWSAPDVALAVPVRDAADELVAALELISRFEYPGVIRVICVANGCVDDSAERARALRPLFLQRGWDLSVLEVDSAGKPSALRVAERAAPEGLFGLLDVSVRPDVNALRLMVEAVWAGDRSVVSGQLRYVESGSPIVQRFARAYRCTPYARSKDLKGTFMLFSARQRAIVRSMPDAGSDDRYFLWATSRDQRSSIDGATVEYSFPSKVRPLIRQQLRWKRNNRALDRDVESGDAPGHEGSRWPYFDPMPPLSAAAVYVVITALATAAARVRPGHSQAWRR